MFDHSPARDQNGAEERRGTAILIGLDTDERIARSGRIRVLGRVKSLDRQEDHAEPRVDQNTPLSDLETLTRGYGLVEGPRADGPGNL